MALYCRFMIKELLPDLFNPKEHIRENSFVLFERLANMFSLSLPELLQKPLSKYLIKRFGHFSDFLTHHGEMNTRKSKSMTISNSIDLSTDIFNDNDNYVSHSSLFGQIILQISYGSNLPRSAVFDVFSWMLSQQHPPLQFSASFLHR